MSEAEVSTGGTTESQSTAPASTSESTPAAAASTPASVQTPASSTAAAIQAAKTSAAKTIPDSVTTPASGDPAADAWQPNYKFKVKDKELEFDDSMKELIKSKDLEAKMRDLHEKAYGLDEVKAGRETVKQQLMEQQQKFGQVETSLKTLGALVQKKDYESFFQTLNIPKQDIINYAIQELKYQELPAEQKAAIDQQRQLQMGYQEQLTSNAQLQQQLSQVVVQQTNFEINQELARPEVTQVSQSYDARVGKPGAFREEILRRGQYYENVHKISPPVSQLVNEILNLVGVSAPAQQGDGNISQSNGQASQVVHNQQNKPVIPSFSGSSGKSPTKKVPTSIADLKQMRADLQQRQS